MIDLRYKIFKKGEFLLIECLEDMEKRVFVYWYLEIVLILKSGNKVIILLYGNIICLLVKYLDNFLSDGVVLLNIFISILFVYELDENLCLICYYYLSMDGEVFEGEILKYIFF